MATLEKDFGNHEKHCHEFRNETRKDIVSIKSTMARWSALWGLLNVLVSALAAGIVIHYVGQVFGR